MLRSHVVGIRVLLCVLLVASVLMTGCRQGESMRSGESDPAGAHTSTEFIVHTNDELGFAAQFPAKPREDTSSWEGVAGSSLHLDSFNPPPGYDPTVEGIAVPRTVLRVYRPDSWPRKIDLGEVYEEWQLKEVMTSDVEMELPSLLMQSTGDIHPPIEFATRNGHPSATTIFPLTDSERTIWCYVTVVYRDDGDRFSLAGLRETEDQAILAEASFRLLDEPEASRTATSGRLQIPDGAVGWSEARKHVGETVTIHGPVLGSKYASTSSGQPTFIDIGAPYPDTSRVSIVVWGDHRASFPGSPEDIYLGKTISVTGEIYIHNGVCNIEVQSPSQIQVVER